MTKKTKTSGGKLAGSKKLGRVESLRSRLAANHNETLLRA